MLSFCFISLFCYILVVSSLVCPRSLSYLSLVSVYCFFVIPFTSFSPLSFCSISLFLCFVLVSSSMFVFPLFFCLFFSLHWFFLLLLHHIFLSSFTSLLSFSFPHSLIPSLLTTLLFILILLIPPSPFSIVHISFNFSSWTLFSRLLFSYTISLSHHHHHPSFFSLVCFWFFFFFFSGAFFSSLICLSVFLYLSHHHPFFSRLLCFRFFSTFLLTFPLPSLSHYRLWKPSSVFLHSSSSPFTRQRHSPVAY